MKAMTSPTRTSIDVATLTPDALATLSERDFRVVVTADMKRDASNERIRNEVPAWITHALRHDYVERWVASLRAMLANIEGQLAQRDNTLEQAKAELDEVELRERTARHFKELTGPLRFRSALLEALPEAERLLEGRVSTLEAAIRTHRATTEADDTVDPSHADRLLWSSLPD
jgi:hypothetical protein